MRNFSRELEALLVPESLQMLRHIGQAASQREEKVYLVGGVVRDILLERENLDLDLVVEGKAISLARQIARENNWNIKTHPRFSTANIYAQNLSLDLVTARSEIYIHPGALPVVKSGTIQEDLARRDFTINALAISITPDSFGELLDPHNGQNDLDRKLVRILHPESFKDDPTRILRAVRYEQRLDFHLEQATEELLQQNLDGLNTVTGERLWHELGLILNEEYPEKAFVRADNLGMFRKLYPPMKGDSWLSDKFAQARDSNQEPSALTAVYLVIMVYRFDSEEAEGCINRFKMPGWATRLVRDTMKIRNSLALLEVPEFRHSQIYYQLKHHMPEVIKGMAVVSDSSIVRQRLELYLQKLRHIKPELSGNDLQSMGVAPGKKMGRILRALQEARIDKTISNREEEKVLVKSLL